MIEREKGGASECFFGGFERGIGSLFHDMDDSVSFFFFQNFNAAAKTHSKNSASAALPELGTRARCSPASVTAAARAEAAAASRRALVAAEGGMKGTREERKDE